VPSIVKIVEVTMAQRKLAETGLNTRSFNAQMISHIKNPQELPEKHDLT
jgi:hypothetical protein